ncbi:MAG: hypothetical protein ACOC24_03210 [Desulfovibrionales bacterium]
MKMQEIRILAREQGIKFKVGTTKAEAIRALQRSEGNFDCFGTAQAGECDQEQCLFREDCLPEEKNIPAK